MNPIGSARKAIFSAWANYFIYDKIDFLGWGRRKDIKSTESFIK